MKEVSDPIKEGSEGFLKTQYTTIASISVIVSAVLCLIYLNRSTTAVSSVNNKTFALCTGFSFLLGATCSGISGYVGMWVSVRANVRVCSAARRCYNECL